MFRLKPISFSIRPANEMYRMYSKTLYVCAIISELMKFHIQFAILKTGNVPDIDSVMKIYNIF